ncbi:MAG: DUF1573 domain-containing protein [Candidatus Sungbacteria bacterium]|uniref:DUF1573 domain-containing protein n=1 Tax=Candidatus Sungiibacteriota bacterium TaxID=2750080 RepID=A0A931YDZ3_9BACT|nr:DUF1573 domain-containing protein [Candidatus Sungbacteria bacterium]
MNTKNIIIYVLFTVAIVGGLVWIARPNKDTGADPTASVISTLTAPENQYDFGSISMANGNVSKIFTVSNSSPEPVTLEKIYTSCMCTQANLILSGQKFGPYGMPGHGLVPKVNRTLNAGETAEIEVVFDPNAHGPAGVGPIERIIFVEQKGRQPLELNIKAMVTP